MQHHRSRLKADACAAGAACSWRAELDALCDQVQRAFSPHADGADKDKKHGDADDTDADDTDDDDAASEKDAATAARTAAMVSLGSGLEVAFGTDPAAGIAAAIDRGCRVAASIALSDPDGDKDGDGDGDVGVHRARALRVLSVLYYADQALSASVAAWRILSDGGGVGGTVHEGELAAGVARFCAPDPEEANRMQQLLLYLLNTAQARGYRRRHGEMYRRRLAPGGVHDTHAWERVSDMREFVYDVTRKELNFDMWLNMTCMRTNVQAAVDHLTSCNDVQLPELHRDRHVFAFTDGIYLAAEDRFTPYGSQQHAALPTDLVAAKYFDLPFPASALSAGGKDGDGDGDGDWYVSIPTPHLQSILDYQEMGDDVSRWMYAMLGRLVYEVGELDGWQVLPFLKGAASSGKSTILTRVARNFYEAADVGTLSNNIERKFGLSALADKLMFIGPEIKADIQLEQAEFQSIVSGEAVQIAAKFKTAQTVVWRVPGALAGNEVPGWVDNSGSINRRIVIFEFPKRVHDGDMELGRKVELELPSTLVKANRAYLQAVARYHRSNLWKHLPAAFHAAKDDFSESINSIVHFLRSGQLAFGPGVYMPFENFAAAYEVYVSSMGLTRLKLTGDKIAQPLMEANCRIAKNQTMRYPRPAAPASSSASYTALVTGRFVLGCDTLPRGHYSIGGGDCGGDDIDL